MTTPMTTPRLTLPSPGTAGCQYVEKETFLEWLELLVSRKGACAELKSVRFASPNKIGFHQAGIYDDVNTVFWVAKDKVIVMSRLRPEAKAARFHELARRFGLSYLELVCQLQTPEGLEALIAQVIKPPQPQGERPKGLKREYLTLYSWLNALAHFVFFRDAVPVMTEDVDADCVGFKHEGRLHQIMRSRLAVNLELLKSVSWKNMLSLLGLEHAPEALSEFVSTHSGRNAFLTHLNTVKVERAGDFIGPAGSVKDIYENQLFNQLYKGQLSGADTLHTKEYLVAQEDKFRKQIYKGLGVSDPLLSPVSSATNPSTPNRLMNNKTRNSPNAPLNAPALNPDDRKDRIIDALVERNRLLEVELKKVSDRDEQHQVKLAGCLMAAEGCHGGAENIATKGMYGWSLAYQTTLELRANYDDARSALAGVKETLDDLSYARRAKEPTWNKGGKKLPSLFEYRENKDIVAKDILRPEDLLAAFKVIEDGGVKPRMVLMHGRDYADVRMFGRDLLDLDLKALNLKLGPVGFVNGVPLYIHKDHPKGEILVLGHVPENGGSNPNPGRTKPSPRGVVVIRVEREG